MPLIFWNNVSIWEILTVLVCFLLSAFFSSVETALTSITPTKAVQLMDDESIRAKNIKHWFHDPSRLITTILIGNSTASIVASSVTTLIAKKIFGGFGIAVTLGVMTFLILTFGEIVPKIFARANAVKLSLALMPLLMFFYYLLYPFTSLFVYMTEKVFKSTTSQHSRRGPLVTLKDLDFFISLAQKEGALTGSKKGMYLKAVSEFSDLKVKHIMVPKNKVSIIDSDIDIKKLTQIIQKDMFTRYPVVNDNGNFIGVLHAKDLLLNIDICEKENSILSILRPPFWTNEFMKVDTVLEMMKAKKSQMFLVKDEYDQFNGIITMEDILEELVGEIEDEHDMEDEVDCNGNMNVFVISGDDSIHDLNTKYSLNIPDDKDFQTFNGFLLDLLNGVLPKKETIITWENLKIRIIKNKNKNVEQAEITIL
ncbi:MAG: hemolysin family protein [bacterium]